MYVCLLVDLKTENEAATLLLILVLNNWSDYRKFKCSSYFGFFPFDLPPDFLGAYYVLMSVNISSIVNISLFDCASASCL